MQCGRGAFIHAHSATALNFQITMVIAAVVGAITAFVLVGLLIVLGVGIAVLACGIIAAMAANCSELFRYPFAVEFVK